MTSAQRKSTRRARSAADPWLDGQPPHVPSDGATLPRVCLLPGDPARVDLAGELFDDFSVVGRRREFTLGVGSTGGVDVAVCSTGIGGPSTEIAVVELRRLGVETFVRIGGMGAVSPRLAPGSIVRVDAVVREGGAAGWYAEHRELRATTAVTRALVAASTACGVDLAPARVLSTDSYYLGQGRAIPGLHGARARRVEDVAALGVDGMDMECETVFAVAGALGARFGALLCAHGNRASDGWLEDYEPAQRRLLAVAIAACPELDRTGRGARRDHTDPPAIVAGA